MIVRLNPGELLRVTKAAGAAVEVLSGLVWITEEGCEEDNFVASGRRHRLTGDGLVLIGAERHDGNTASAEIALRPGMETRERSLVVTFRARTWYVREVDQLGAAQ